MKVHMNTNTRKRDISAIIDAFLDQKRVNVYEHAVKWHHVSVYESCHQGVARQEAGKCGGWREN